MQKYSSMPTTVFNWQVTSKNCVLLPAKVMESSIKALFWLEKLKEKMWYELMKTILTDGKEIRKIYKRKYANVYFSLNGPINLIFGPDCYIFKYTSIDTHIDTTYVRHMSSVIAEICYLCQISDVSDDRWRTLVISILVSKEVYLQIKQSVQKIKLIGPFSEKLEPKRSTQTKML